MKFAFCIFIFVVVCMEKSTLALKCYQCTGDTCASGNCEISGGACYKAITAGVTTKLCSPTSVVTAGSCTNVDSSNSLCTCNDKDYCNAGYIARHSTVLFVLSLAVALLFKF